MAMVKTQESTARMVASKLLEIGAIKLNYKDPFTWNSGLKSPIYCDNRLSLSYPTIRTFIKERLVQAINENYPEVKCIAGVATAGIPQGALVAESMGLPFIYVRSQPKDHGMGKQIEGKIVADQKVVLIEDLISTGGSSIRAIQTVREAGFHVIGMVAIFTYGFEISEKSFHDQKVPVVCLSNFDYLLNEAINQKSLDEDQLVYVKSWRLDPTNWK